MTKPYFSALSHYCLLPSVVLCRTVTFPSEKITLHGCLQARRNGPFRSYLITRKRAGMMSKEGVRRARSSVRNPWMGIFDLPAGQGLSASQVRIWRPDRGRRESPEALCGLPPTMVRLLRRIIWMISSQR